MSAVRAQGRPGLFYGYVIVAAGFLIMAVSSGALYSFGIFLKPVAEEFGWSRAAATGAYSMGLFVTGACYIVTGRLSDRYGPRVVMTVCGVLLGSGLLLMSGLTALWQFYIFWGLVFALGMSGGFVPLASCISRWFNRKRGIMTGIVVAGVGVGMIAIPPFATWLISAYSWRFAFLVIGAITLVVFAGASQFLKRDPTQRGELPDGDTTAKAAASAPEKTGLTLHEALRSRLFWMVCGLFFCFGFTLRTVSTHIVPHATDLGISSVAAATILSVIGGVGIPGRIGIGSVCDRLGGRLSLIIALALLCVALFLLLPAEEAWQFYLVATVFGLSTGGIIALESPVIAEFFGLKAHGTILGPVVFCSTGGGAIGSLIGGQIFDATADYFLAFLICSILIIIALALALLLKPHRI